MEQIEQLQEEKEHQKGNIRMKDNPDTMPKKGNRVFSEEKKDHKRIIEEIRRPVAISSTQGAQFTEECRDSMLYLQLTIIPRPCSHRSRRTSCPPYCP
jgi:hypothetical protein